MFVNPIQRGPITTSEHNTNKEIKKIIHFPSNHLFSKPSKTPPPITITQSSLEELDALLGKQGNKIEETMKKLQAEKDTYQAISSTMEGKNTLLTYYEATNAVVKEGIEFIESLFPRKVLMKYSNNEQFTEEQMDCMTLMQTLNFGLTGLSLIYKKKILDESIKLLNEIKNDYKGTSLPKDVIEWEIQIALQKESLRKSLLQYSLKAGQETVTILKYPVIYFAKIIPAAQVVLSILGSIGAALGFIISYIDMTLKAKILKTHKVWMKKFQKWEQTTQPQIDLTQRKWSVKPKIARSVLEQKMSHIVKNYKAELDLIIKNSEINEVRAILKTFNFELPSHIKTKKQLLQKWSQKSFKRRLVKQYTHYQNTFENLRFIEKKSKNLLEKREASMLLKVRTIKNEITLYKPKLEAFKLKNIQFSQENVAEPSDTFLKAYIDHQETLSRAAKNGIKVLVDKKHQLINKFMSFSYTTSRRTFALLLASATLSSILAAFYFVGWPVTVPATLLLLLTSGIALRGNALILASLYGAYRYQRSFFNPMTHLEQISLSFKQLYLGIKKFSMISNRKRLTKTGKALMKLHKNPQAFRKAFQDYEEAKKEFIDSKNQVEIWNRKIENLSNHMKYRLWRDFDRYIKEDRNKQMQSPDILSSISNALKECDVTLLDKDTKTFFQRFLGFNLEKTQKQIKKEPEALQWAIANFFTLDEVSFYGFIESQEARLAAKTLVSS